MPNKNNHNYLNCMRLDYLHLFNIKHVAMDNAEAKMRIQNSSVKSNSNETCKYIENNAILTKCLCFESYFS